MDQLPLDHNPVPATGPRNLTLGLAAWLRGMGFCVTEQGGPDPIGLSATWRDDEQVFQVAYVFSGALSALRLTCTNRRTLASEPLVASAYVHRLREARFLLLSSTIYAPARKRALAAGTLAPAPAAGL